MRPSNRLSPLRALLAGAALVVSPAVLAGPPADAVRVAASADLFVDGTSTFVRAGADSGLVVGQALDVFGPDLGGGARRKVGKATIMEVYSGMSRVSLDAAAAKTGGERVIALGGTTAPPPQGAMPPGYGGTTAPPPQGAMPPGYGGTTAPPPQGAMPPGYGATTATPRPGSAMPAGYGGTTAPPPQGGLPPGYGAPPPAGPKPAPAPAGLSGTVRLQRTPLQAVVLTNTSAVPWSNCTVYVPGQRRCALKSLGGGMTREMPMQYFTADGAAPQLRDEVRVVCAQGTVSIPAHE